MSATIYDIAKAADVSIATVSRVFNGHPRVSEKTRRKVEEAARARNYQPHVSARDLARKNSYVISAVIPMMTNYFFMEVLRGIQERLAESDFDLTIYSALEPDQLDCQLERASQRGRSEGVVLFSTWLSEKTADLLSSASQPVVLVDSAHPLFDSVTVDNLTGGWLATGHLLDAGYKKIGLLAADAHSSPAKDRRTGYERALQERGVPVEESLIAGSRGERLNGFSEEAGYDDMVELLAVRPDVEAVFATSDVQALGAMKAATERGLSIPGDIGLVGYDDIRVSEHVGLTTVQQPMYRMGQMAAEYLIKRVETAGAGPVHTQLNPQLVVRKTTTRNPVISS